MKKRILVVDDDRTIRFAITTFLEACGYQTVTADDVASAQIAFRTHRPDAAVVDFVLPDGDALALIERFRAIDAECPVVVLTGHASIDIAVRAIQEGASHFLTKPIELPVLRTVIERLLETEVLRRKEAASRSAAANATAVSPFVGTSTAMRELEARVRRVLATDSPVLIAGETGSGKGVLARWMHENGPRSAGPLVDLNCAGLTREFLDTELFGHEKGAFTGAVASKQGLFEIAHGGTMFLDEIGDVDPQIQPKLLKVVEEKRFRRLGEVIDRSADVRLIGATHRDIERMVREGAFRADLYFRISAIPIAIPALRDRPEDIPLLAAGILAGLCRSLNRGQVRLADDAVAALQRHRWVGNLRELRNVLERALLLGDGDVIAAEALQLGPASPARGDDTLGLTLEELERRHIQAVLDAEDGRVEQAALRLGISRSSLYSKIRQYALRQSRIQKGGPEAGPGTGVTER